MSKTTISLCMIVLNEEAFIATALKNVSPFVDEIIVVDGGSKDGTLQIVSKFKKVKVIQNAWPENFSEQRNISLKHATKDWVLVMDADEVYEKKLLDQKNQKELIAFQKMGNINEIISRLKKQVFLHPKDAQGWYLLGQLYFSQNQFTNAEAAFNKAEILAPNRKDIFIQKIEAAYLSNNPKLPELLNQALKNAPDDPSLLNIQALIFYQQKKYDQALNIWQNLLLQAPKNSDAANALEQAIKSTEAKINHISA